jgi:N-acetylglutamate synthase-like GNAT family acetyltransferase
MNFRKAVTGDAESIAAIVNAAFRVERFFIERDRISVEKVSDLLGKGDFLLAEDAGGLVACVYVELRGERGYFGLLAVDPMRQKEGLGRRLVEAAENHARAANCRAMEMRIVNLRAELPAFYRKLGYTETGTAPFSADVQPKIPCHFINMSKPL